jgi:hypothetical protein
VRRRLLLALVAVALALALVPVASAGEVVVGIDRTRVSTSLGRSFSFTTTVANRGTGPTGTLVAHLNILSLKPGLYVDPEDWSSDRTHYLHPIPPGGSRAVRWRVKAVNGGSLAAYVTVVPQSGAGTPATSRALRFDATSRKTLNSGGVLPIALGVPGGIALLALAVRVQRRRRGRRVRIRVV